MKPEGWIFMISSITAVIALTVYCFYRVLTTPSSAELEAEPQSRKP
jgi:hypothetical protein